MNNDKIIDECIKANLKDIIENENVPVDIEKSWEKFEKKLKATQGEQKKFINKRLITVVALIVILVVSAPIFKPNELVAFKDNVYNWLNTSKEDIEIKEKINPEIQEGFYENLNFEEAQNLTIYHLKYPNYLPESINIKPIIGVEIAKYPHAISFINFNNNNIYLSLKQENIIGEKAGNIHVPKNSEILKLADSYIEYMVIRNGEDSFQILWKDNSIKYTILSKGFNYDEVVNILKGIK